MKKRKAQRRDKVLEGIISLFSPAEKKRLQAARLGPCQICGKLPGKNRLHVVDYDRKLGKTKMALRGILCKKCEEGVRWGG